MRRTTIVLSPMEHETRVQFILTSGRSIVRYLPNEYTADVIQSWAERTASLYEKRYTYSDSD